MDRDPDLMKKLAIVWGERRDHKPFETHHGFWERAAREHPELDVQRYLWSEIPEIPPIFDLYLFVDFHPSLYRIPERLRPRALYWWDAFHYSFAYPAQICEHFDAAFFAERLTARMLNMYGYAHAEWLAGAFDPGLYRPVDHPKVHDYAFIGQQDDVVVRHGYTRADFIRRLSQAKDLHGYVGQGVHGELVNQVYNESKILFDWTIFNNLGTRFFETVGSGGFLLVNRSVADNGMGWAGVDGEHFVSYDGSWTDFEKKFRHYLADGAARTAIAAAGRDHFLRRHTYAHRLDVILRQFKLPARFP